MIQDIESPCERLTSTKIGDVILTYIQLNLSSSDHKKKTKKHQQKTPEIDQCVVENEIRKIVKHTQTHTNTHPLVHKNKNNDNLFQEIINLFLLVFTIDN